MAVDKKLNIVVSLKDLASKGLAKITKKLKSALSPTKLLSQALKGLSRAFGTLRRAVFGLPGLIAGLGIGLLAKNFIDAASTAEQFRTRLTVLLGSVKEGNRLFKEMSDLAGRVPKTYEEIMASATSLAGVMKGGVDEIAAWMPMIVDLSAAVGMTLEETTSQIIRMYSAGAASADMFRERGVLAMLGFQSGVSYSAEKTRLMLMRAWEEPTSKFRGAARLLANTWEGLMSMLGDAWFQFRTMVMDSGLFDFLKAGIKTILDEIQRLKDEGRLEEWAQSISDAVINGLKKAIMFVGRVIDGLHHIAGILVQAFLDIKIAMEKMLAAMPDFMYESTREIAEDYEFAQKNIKLLRKEVPRLTAEHERLSKEAEKYRTAFGWRSDEWHAAFKKHRQEYLENLRRLEQAKADLQRAERASGDIDVRKVQAGLETLESERKLSALAERLKDTKTYTEAATWAIRTLEGTVADWDEQETKDAVDKAELERRQRLLGPRKVVGDRTSALDRAKAELVVAKAVNAAKTALLKRHLDLEIISIDEYYDQRVKMLEGQYETEGAMLKEQLVDAGKENLKKRAEVNAKIDAMKRKQLLDELKLESSMEKLREKHLKDRLKRQEITLEEYHERRATIAAIATAKEVDRVKDQREKAEGNLRAAEKAWKQEQLDIENEYNERLREAAADWDVKMFEDITALQMQDLIREKKNYEDRRKLMEAEVRRLVDLEIKIREAGRERLLQLFRRKHEDLLEEERKLARERGKVMSDVMKAQEWTMTAKERIEAETLAIKEQYDEQRATLQQHLKTLQGMKAKSAEEEIRIAKEKAGILKAIDALESNEAIEIARRTAEIIAELGQGDTFEDLIEKYTGGFGSMASRIKTEWAAIDEMHRQHIEEHGKSYEAFYAKIVAQARIAAKEFQAAFEKTVVPFKGFMSDLNTIFEAFYEQSGKKSKDWARAMKAMQIGIAIIDSLAAGVKAYVAALEIPVVGLYIAPVFAAAAIAAGMARVAMMRSQKLAGGGMVEGHSPHARADNIPIMGTAGEFMHPVKAVDYYGEGAMEAVRRLRVPREVLSQYAGVTPRRGGRMFAQGGSVAASQRAMLDRSGEDESPVQLTNVNVLDPGVFDDYMYSAQGQNTFVNVMTRNKTLVQRLAREQ